MPTQYFQSGSHLSRKGRAKGTPNVSTAVARKGIVQVYEMLGGPLGLLQWSQASSDNLFAFYTVLLPKLLPAEIADQHGKGDTKIQVVILPADGSAPTIPSSPLTITTASTAQEQESDHDEQSDE